MSSANSGYRSEAVMKIILIAFAIMLSGCASMNPFHAIANPPSEPKKMGSWEQTSEPVFVGTIDGKTVVANKTTYRATAEESTPRLTIGQRIGSFFSNLSFVGILFIVLSLLFFGGAPIVWVARKYFDAKNALKNTVKAIKEIPTDKFEAIAPTLSANMDKKDKALIAKIKASL